MLDLCCELRCPYVDMRHTLGTCLQMATIFSLIGDHDFGFLFYHIFENMYSVNYI